MPARAATPSLSRDTHAWSESVAFSPDGKRIVSGSSDKTLKVWEPQTGSETLSLKGHTGSVNSVAFSPDGQRIVTGSADKTVKVWDVRTGSETPLPQGAHRRGQFRGLQPRWQAHRQRQRGQDAEGLGQSDGPARLSPSRATQAGLVRGVQPRWQTHRQRQRWQDGEGLGCRHGQRDALPQGAHRAGAGRGVQCRQQARPVGKDASGTRPGLGRPERSSSPRGDGHHPGCRPQAISPDGRFEAVGGWLHHPDQRSTPFRGGPRGSRRGSERLLERLARFDPEWHRAQATLAETGRAALRGRVPPGLLAPRVSLGRRVCTSARRHALAGQGKAAETSVQLLTALFLHPQVRLRPPDPLAQSRAEAAAQAGDWPRAVLAFQLGRAAAGSSADPVAGPAPGPGGRGPDQGLPPDARRHRPLASRGEGPGCWPTRCCTTARPFPGTRRCCLLLEERTRRDLAAKRNAVTLHRRGVALYRGGQLRAGPDPAGGVDPGPRQGRLRRYLAVPGDDLPKLGQLEQARKHLARFEEWHSKQQFPTWQERILWETLLREARSVVNAPRLMPRVADPD